MIFSLQVKKKTLKNLKKALKTMNLRLLKV